MKTLKFYSALFGNTLKKWEIILGENSFVNDCKGQIWWDIVFQCIEYISTIIVFNQFIYLNIVRSGDIQLYTLFVMGNGKGMIDIQNLMEIHAFQPAKYAIDHWGIFAPYSIDIYNNFFAAAKLSTQAYTGIEIE
jgi:hypothetical protein